MPTRFLSDAEIERLEGWPEAIERREVVRFFMPAGDDLVFVREQRGAANQLAVALQLGALRWLGFVPEELAAAPPEVITALAESLDVPARAIFDYAVRAQTRGGHRLLVRAYAGFRPFSERDLELLGGRFVDAGLEHERPSLLLVRLCEILRAETDRASVDRSHGAAGGVGAGARA